MVKIAIVTGASRGLGKGCASVLANEEGFTVYATGRTTADLEKLAEECAKVGNGKIVPCTLDQKDDEAVKAFVAKVKAEAGKVDLLVNNAYQGLEAQKPFFGKRFYERPIAEFDGHMNVGVRSSYVMASLGCADDGRGKTGPHCPDVLDRRSVVRFQHALQRGSCSDGPAERRHGG